MVSASIRLGFLVALSLIVFGTAKIQPAHASEKITVIVTVKDRMALPVSSRSIATYPLLRQALQANAKASQNSLIQTLLAERKKSGEVRFTPLWIVNAIVVELPATRISVLENHPDVRKIYGNHEVRLISDFRSARHEAIGEAYTYGLNMMNVPQLRAENSKANGEGVVVGILDTGVDAGHPDLQGKVVGFHDFINGKTEPYDDHSHGTHVAGTIAGGDKSGTSIGVAPNSKIIAGKAFSSSGSSSTATLLSAMQWIADPDGNPQTKDQPALVSNSWGGGPPSKNADPSADLFCQAVSSWLKLGIFPVFAAGNSGSREGTVGTPGACPQSYAIGATDDKDQIASFSSRGPTVWKTETLSKPNVSAPGVAILSSIPDGKYGTKSGTSMATPHVAGLLSLVYQVMPNITIDDAAKLVAKSSKDLGPTGPDTDFGAGRVDALATINAAKAFRRAHSR